MLFLLCLFGAFAAPAGDRVVSIPHAPSFSFPLYSGYLAVGPASYLHYIFVEAEQNAASSPVVVWMNGGPGCSSLDGFFYEHGPFKFDDNGDRHNLTMVPNPMSWNKAANMLYLEAPLGVGFSYTKGVSSYTSNDNITADNNAAALQKWAQEFPEFAGNDFYVFGESYGGIYVPTLVYRLANLAPFTKTLKGWGAGNPLTDHRDDTLFEAVLPQVVGRGLIAPAMGDALRKACVGSSPDKTLCQKLQAKLQANLADIDPYNLDGLCWSQRKPQQIVGCINSEKANLLLNSADVKAALHVAPAIHWTICSEHLEYHDITKSVVPIYQWAAAQKGRFRVLVYSGDADSVVSYHGTLGWLTRWNLPLRAAADAWLPWKYADAPEGAPQVAGYATYYAHNVTFTTVRGCSHMVPQSCPRAALQMFKAYLANDKYLG